MASVLRPAQLDAFSLEEIVWIIESIPSPNNLNKELSDKLGSFVPLTELFSKYFKVASGLPIDIIMNATYDEALACLLITCRVEFLDDSRINLLVNNVFDYFYFAFHIQLFFLLVFSRHKKRY